MIINRKKIDTNYERPHIPGCWMDVTNDQWKYKIEDDICGTQMLEGLFAKCDNKTIKKLVDKGFEPNTEDYIRKWIFNVYAQGLLQVKGKSLHEFSENNQWCEIRSPKI